MTRMMVRRCIWNSTGYNQNVTETQPCYEVEHSKRSKFGACHIVGLVESDALQRV
jgi:hypothetical protein